MRSHIGRLTQSKILSVLAQRWRACSPSTLLFAMLTPLYRWSRCSKLRRNTGQAMSEVGTEYVRHISVAGTGRTAYPF